MNRLNIDRQLPHNFKKPFSIIIHSTHVIINFSLSTAICLAWCDHIVEDILQHSNNTLQGEYALIWLQSSAPDDCKRVEHASRLETTLRIHPTCWIRLWIYLNSSELMAFRQAQCFQIVSNSETRGQKVMASSDDQPWESHWDYIYSYSLLWLTTNHFNELKQ